MIYTQVVLYDLSLGYSPVNMWSEFWDRYMQLNIKTTYTSLITKEVLFTKAYKQNIQ